MEGSLNCLIGKDPDAGQDFRLEEKGTTEDEMVEWHHQLNGHEFEPAQGDVEGQGSLVCCSLLGLKESDMTERLNNNKECQGYGEEVLSQAEALFEISRGNQGQPMTRGLLRY